MIFTFMKLTHIEAMVSDSMQLNDQSVREKNIKLHHPYTYTQYMIPIRTGVECNHQAFGQQRSVPSRRRTVIRDEWTPVLLVCLANCIVLARVNVNTIVSKDRTRMASAEFTIKCLISIEIADSCYTHIFITLIQPSKVYHRKLTTHFWLVIDGLKIHNPYCEKGGEETA